MQALILAGGEGSRLAASGVTEPKCLVPVGGVPQLVRLIDACRRVGCREVYCAVRADLVPDVASLAREHSATVVAVEAPTSLHTLVAGLHAMPAGPVFCVLVDTVLPAADWVTAHHQAGLALESADAVVAVTPYVNDEKPLWVDAADDGVVTAFGQRGAVDSVTGGLYWLGPRARMAAAIAVNEGTQRLRGFLSGFVASGARVHTVTIPKIIDIDTAADLAEAVALLEVSGG